MKLSEFEKTFIECYPSMPKLLNNVKSCIGSTSASNLKKPSTQIKLFNFICQTYVNNTAIAYVNKIRRILKKIKIECISYAVHTFEGLNISLTVDELKKIEKLNLKNSHLDYVRNLFLISCYTGARISDAIEFNKNNVVNEMLIYNQKKTKHKVMIPISKKIKNLILKISLSNFKSMKSSIINSDLKQICYLAKINNDVTIIKNGKMLCMPKWKAVTFHTGRRTFCTNLYESGLDLLEISRLAGHSSIEMTKRYITTQRISKISKMKLLKYLA